MFIFTCHVASYYNIVDKHTKTMAISLNNSVYSTMYCSIVFICLLSVVSASQLPENVDSQNGASVRRSYQMPKVFDFELYKQLFCKSYTSIIEELARQKLFLGRAISSFLSGVAYKHWRSSDYLSVNHMSDRSQDELNALNNNIEEDKIDSKELEALSSAHESSKAPETNPEKPVTSCKVAERNFSFYELIEGLKENSDELKKTDYEEENSQGFRLPFLYWYASDYEPKNRKCKTMPDEVFVDHRKDGCMNDIQAQGYCGSCYAFAAVAYFEWLHCTKNKELLKFSEQYVVDCGPYTKYGQYQDLKGCSGGKMSAVAEYFEDYGAEFASEYPYKAREGYCPYEDPSKNSSEMGYLKFPDDVSNQFLILSKNFGPFLVYSPIVVTLQVNNRFFWYGGGVDMGRSCCTIDKDKRCSLHAVLIVGYGRQDDKEYWLIRNSYSTSWGEEGYYKLSIDADQCIYQKVGRAFATYDGVKHMYRTKINEKRPGWVNERIKDISRIMKRKRYE